MSEMPIFFTGQLLNTLFVGFLCFVALWGGLWLAASALALWAAWSGMTCAYIWKQP